ncbi:hypothetical protein [Miltoncostaea oceani]|uniref:hypothetical protein n=1 Tax=Miltoncostaea oceani TaxID=2843216 RepID=UPI001C3CF289|nr:hypothetical protein [Miltoncostaea oceani]
MNRPGDDTSGLRAAVRAALEAADLEPAVRALLELRFPAEGPGASLDETGAALSMSPAMVAHIEFAALCAVAARGRPGASAAIQTASAAATTAGPSHAERKSA